MSKVVTFVDKGKLESNTKWLVTKSKEVTNSAESAIIYWGLSQVKDSDIQINDLESLNKNSEDPYVKGLIAAAFANLKKAKQLNEINKQVKELMGKGNTDESATATYLNMETRCLAVANWIDDDSSAFAKEIDAGISFIMANIGNGASLGSSEATVMCLRALCKYSDNFGRLEGSGKLRLTVGED